MTKTTQPPPDNAHWQEMEPHLDAALASLSASDRRAITLRYFEDLALDEVARRLGLSDAAARQRVHRATMRMRVFFAARGVNVPAVALGPVIAAHAAIHSAPAALVTNLAGVSLAAKSIVGSAGVLGHAKAAVTIMATTQIKFLAAAAVLVVLAGGAYVGHTIIFPSHRMTVVVSPNNQITDLSAKDWKKPFMDAYELPPGQTVKLVERVPVPERLRYWKSLSNNPGFPLTPESTLFFKANGSDLHWTNITPGWIPLGWAIGFMAKVQTWQMDASIPQGMKFTGDWVFAEQATPDQVMEALAQIVSQRLGRQVRFVKRTVVRDVLIARGTYKFVPLAGYADDNIVQLTDRPLGNHDARFIFSAPVADLLGRISMAKSMQVIDETGHGNKKIKMCDQQNWRDADAFVRTVTSQTSLRLDREPRQIDVWFMVDSNGTTLPGQN